MTLANDKILDDIFNLGTQLWLPPTESKLPSETVISEASFGGESCENVCSMSGLDILKGPLVERKADSGSFDELTGSLKPILGESYDAETWSFDQAHADAQASLAIYAQASPSSAMPWDTVSQGVTSSQGSEWWNQADLSQGRMDVDMLGCSQSLTKKSKEGRSTSLCASQGLNSQLWSLPALNQQQQNSAPSSESQRLFSPPIESMPIHMPQPRTPLSAPTLDFVQDHFDDFAFGQDSQIVTDESRLNTLAWWASSIRPPPPVTSAADLSPHRRHKPRAPSAGARYQAIGSSPRKRGSSSQIRQPSESSNESSPSPPGTSFCTMRSSSHGRHQAKRQQRKTSSLQSLHSSFALLDRVTIGDGKLWGLDEPAGLLAHSKSFRSIPSTAPVQFGSNATGDSVGAAHQHKIGESLPTTSELLGAEAVSTKSSSRLFDALVPTALNRPVSGPNISVSMADVPAQSITRPSLQQYYSPFPYPVRRNGLKRSSKISSFRRSRSTSSVFSALFSNTIAHRPKLNSPSHEDSICSRISRARSTIASTGTHNDGDSSRGNTTSRRSRSVGPSNIGFVNYTPDDKGVLMTGVAPSGSSKTKARREKEATDRQRKLGEAVVKAASAVGVDVSGVLQEEGLVVYM